jgi:hypothetical protein
MPLTHRYARVLPPGSSIGRLLSQPKPNEARVSACRLPGVAEQRECLPLACESQRGRAASRTPRTLPTTRPPTNRGRVLRVTKFCSDRCRYRHRDRLKYAADPDGERAKSRRYYGANRDAVTARKREVARRWGG